MFFRFWFFLGELLERSSPSPSRTFTALFHTSWGMLDFKTSGTADSSQGPLPCLLQSVVFSSDKKTKRLPIQRIRTRKARYHLISHTKRIHSPSRMHSPITVGTVANYQSSKKEPLPSHRSQATSISIPQGLAPTAPSLRVPRDLLLLLIAFRKVYHSFDRLSTL